MVIIKTKIKQQLENLVQDSNFYFLIFLLEKLFYEVNYSGKYIWSIFNLA